MSTRLSRSFLCAGLLALVLAFAGPLSAQIPGVSENDRLMEEYMIRRAEWLELRKGALEKVKAARDQSERKHHLARLAEDEKPLLERMAAAARAFKAAEKAKRDRIEAEHKPAK